MTRSCGELSVPKAACRALRVSWYTRPPGDCCLRFASQFCPPLESPTASCCPRKRGLSLGRSSLRVNGNDKGRDLTKFVLLRTPIDQIPGPVDSCHEKSVFVTTRIDRFVQRAISLRAITSPSTEYSLLLEGVMHALNESTLQDNLLMSGATRHPTWACRSSRVRPNKRSQKHESDSPGKQVRCNPKCTNRRLSRFGGGQWARSTADENANRPTTRPQIVRAIENESLLARTFRVDIESRDRKGGGEDRSFVVLSRT